MTVGENEQAYVSMMVDSLQKKRDLLSDMLEQTKKQERLLLSDDVDADELEKTIAEKGTSLEQLDKLDNGFDALFKKLEKELLNDRVKYESEVRKMKELIKQITELGSGIQAMEKLNYERFQKYISGERTKIKKANMSQQTASTYARNMAGQHSLGNSYFVNETK